MSARIISIICALCVLMSAFAIPVFAEEAWSDFAKSGAEVQSDGSIKITSADSAVSSITKSQSVSTSYVFTTELQITSFSGETGIQVNTGKKRLFVRIRAGEIEIAGAKLAYKVGGGYHKYVFDVNQNIVDLYVDNNYIGQGRTQDNGTAARVYFWAKSLAGETAVMNIKSAALEKKEVYKPVTESEKTEQFEQPWDSRLDWFLTDDNAVTIGDGIMTIARTESGGVCQALKNITLSENFDYEFRLKVNKYTDGETGSKIEWSPYRMFFYFKEDMLTSRTANGNVGTQLDIGYDWHVWRAEVRGDKASIYMDDAFVVSYTLEPYSLDQAIMTYWVKPKADDEPSLSVDWTRYTPVDYSMQMSSPKNGSVFVEGTSVTLDVEGASGDSGTITYYVNNLPVSGSEGTAAVWEKAGCGEYSIYAVDEQGRKTEAVTVNVIKGFGANIKLPKEIRYGEALKPEFEKYSFDGAEISGIDCYLDGEKLNSAEITGLKAGAHSIYGVVKQQNGLTSVTDTANIIVRAGKEECLVEESYELDFKLTDINADAQIKIGDGCYLLDMNYSGGKLSYSTNEGEQTRESRAAYKICVDYGQALVYENGVFAFSFLMPKTDGKGVRIIDDNNVLDGFEIGAAAEKGSYFIHRGGEAEINAESFFMTQKYALEFDKTDCTSEKIVLYDSGYLLDMEIDGDITVLTAPLGTLGGCEYEAIASAPEQGGIYRIVSSRGIAQLFIDNKFIASFRMPEYISSPSLNRTIGGADKTTFTAIRKTEDVYYFFDNFSNGLDYWSAEGVSARINTERASISGSGAFLLNVSAKNPKLSADVFIQDTDTGRIGLYLKYQSPYSWTRAVYDIEKGLWSIEEKFLDEKTVASKDGYLPVGEWCNLSLDCDGKNVRVLCNGAEVISTGDLEYTYHGRIGFYTDNASMYADNVSYTGNGRPAEGIKYLAFNDCHTVDFMENGGKLYMIGAGASGFKSSSDGGLTWVNESNPNQLTSNTLKLKSGSIITVQRVNGPQENTYWDEAKVSVDGGETFSPAVRIETRVSNRVTMNNKLTELEDGRVVMCVGETGHGLEDYGAMGIYYSDDEGKSWKEGMQITIFNTGVNVQEGKVIELPDGTLRCYMRTDRGFLYYSDSHDRGATWETELTKSQFISPLCAMNIERDPYNKNTYYMTWEYDNKNANIAKQFPRYRTALAVSYDGCETWEYVMDVEEFDELANINVHANQGIRIFEDKIFINVVSYEPGTSGARTLMNKVFIIDKASVKTTKRFDSVHTLEDTSLGGQKGIIEGSMAIMPEKGAAMVLGEVVDMQSPDGTVDAELFARQFGLRAELGDKTRLYFGNTEAEFEAGSIPLKQAAEIFGKTVVETGEYVIITGRSWSDTMTKALDKLLKRTAPEAEGSK